MGSDQHFCLRWNNFHSNIAASFEHLRDHEEFVDVTLACEGRSLKAHKIVLSACSPYFKNLLKQNPCQHPIIILRDVAFPDLSALLSFVYQGEVYVSQERLPTFLRTAEMLHIKGLTEQNQHHPSSTAPVTIGPSSCTTVLKATHDQGTINNRVSSHSVTPCSTRCSTPPSPRKPLSPPPKKRRSATITPLTSPNTPTSSCASPRMEIIASNEGGLEGSTFTAALTKPLGSLSRRSELIVTPSTRLTSSGGDYVSPSSEDCLPKVIKQETTEEDIKEIKEEEDQQAVNLVMEGSSILRQRIQGFHGSPETPLSHLGNNGRGILSSHEESSMDEGFIGTDGVGEGDEHDKGSPMVIRSPLVGLLPMEAPGLYGGAGTSGSLSHHDSSQEDNPYEARPCPVCHKLISNRANLKKHLKIRHSAQEEATCLYCRKVFRNKYSLWTHINSYHPGAKLPQPPHVSYLPPNGGASNSTCDSRDIDGSSL